MARSDAALGQIAGPVCVRPMVLGDVDRVLEIATGLASAPHWRRSVYEGAISAAGMPARIALVAELNGVVRGFLLASLVLPQAEVESIAVEQRLQGQGIGRALIGALFDEAQASGADEVLLELRASNLQAARFYERAGFCLVGRRPGYYREPVEDALLLRCALDPVSLPNNGGT